MALNHVFAKPELIVKTGLGLLEQELTVPNLFQKEDFANYAGAKNGTLNVEVEGLLPFREWVLRSGEKHEVGQSPYAGDRSVGTPTTRQKIQYDRYTERTLPLTLTGAAYSAVEVTDEQMTFDLGTWTDKIASKQIRAVARGMQYGAIKEVVNAPYEVVLGDLAGVEGGALKGLTEGRRVLNAFNAPAEGRVALVGTDFETALGADSNVKFANEGGDAAAETALRDATLGRLKGFTVIVSNDIPSGDAYLFYQSAFVMATAAPKVPLSVKHGSVSSYDGIAMRWITDYANDDQVDRSTFMTYTGFRNITDLLTYFVEDGNGLGQEKMSAEPHFVRGIKLSLDGATKYPESGSDLAIATGIHTGPSRILFPQVAGADAAPSTPAND
jgi:hypothetical protein